jgi:predicted nuclease of predicted toxin-antitoxin system
MNLLADESVEALIVDRLREEGHQILYVAEMDPGISDEIILSQANQNNSLLITADKDFGELVFRRRLINSGVMLLRLAGLSEQSKASIVAAVFSEYSTEIPEAFTVVSPGMVRVRPKI